MSDSGNQFHYFRRSADDRILWGGYDAVYHPGNRVTPAHDARPTTFEKLARQFVETFPQLGGHPVHPRLGRRHRHDDAVHGHLRRRPRRAGPLRARATPGSASGRADGRRGSCATGCSGPTRRCSTSSSSGRGRSRSRPSRSGRPAVELCAARSSGRRPRGPPLLVPARDGHAGDRLRLLDRLRGAIDVDGAIETMRVESLRLGLPILFAIERARRDRRAAAPAGSLGRMDVGRQPADRGPAAGPACGPGSPSSATRGARARIRGARARIHRDLGRHDAALDREGAGRTHRRPGRRSPRRADGGDEPGLGRPHAAHGLVAVVAILAYAVVSARLPRGDQGPGVTQRGSSRVSVASGREPWPIPRRGSA